MEHTGPAYPNPSTTKPCPECPAILWHNLHNPANRDAEKQIRADEARLWMRRLDRAEQTLAKTNERIDTLQAEIRRLRARKAS